MSKFLPGKWIYIDENNAVYVTNPKDFDRDPSSFWIKFEEGALVKLYKILKRLFIWNQKVKE